MFTSRLCGTVGTLFLMFTAATTHALAQFGDAGASAFLQKAKEALPDRRVEAETLFKQAMAVPGQSQVGYADTAIALATFLIGEQRSASEIRPLAQKAARLYSESAAEKGKIALTFEILASVPDPESDPGEFAAASARAQALRSEIIESLQAQSREAGNSPINPPYRIGQGIIAPVPLARSEPSYTEPARLARKQGGVLLSIVIDEHGKARDVQILQGLGFGLDESAYRAMSNWQFEPARLNDMPVRVIANVEFNFRLL